MAARPNPSARNTPEPRLQKLRIADHLLENP
jgi:hypothetical protein